MRNKKHVKPIKCGMLFSRSLMQPEDLKSEISAEASHLLGDPDIDDALVFHELSVGLHVQFKTYWEPDRDGFTIARRNCMGEPDIVEDMICMLTTEKGNLKLNRRVNRPFLEGKRVLEWVRVKKLVRLGVRIAVRHACFLEGDAKKFWVVGDTRWLPKPFMRNHVRLGEGAERRVFVSL